MTKLEIIEETTSYYNLSNRASMQQNGNSDACIYEDSKGNKCALGRCLIQTSHLVDVAAVSIDTLIVLSKVESLDELLKEEYRGHAKFFWGSLQDFHDDKNNFTDDGLSDKGKYEKELLISIYKKTNERDKDTGN